jgi:hypothetical protein
VSRALALLCTAVAFALAAGSARAQIARTVDRTQWAIHVDVADQLDLAALRRYLAEADRLLQGDEGSSDVACCVTLQAAAPAGRPDAEALVTFGAPGDGLDVIDSLEKWNQIQGLRAIVQTISWCSYNNPSLIGCATTQPFGNTLVVALDAGPEAFARLLAHERGHNTGLVHRSSACAVMAPSISSVSGCLTTSECTSYRTYLANGSTQGTGSCDCMGPAVGDAVRADGAACTAFDGSPGTCHHAGMCDPPPANESCAAGAPLSGAVTHVDENYNAQTDGAASCGPSVADVWYRYVPDCTGQVDVDLCDADPQLQVSAHRSCTSGSQDELVCSRSCTTRAGCSASSCASAPAVAGEPLWLRVASQSAETGPFVLRATCRGADADADGVADGADNCPRWPNAAQVDSDQNGIGDACECGDQNGDGRVDTSDLVAINLALFDPALATPLCDANADERCDVRDISAANRKIFGSPAYCSRYPP